MEKRRGSTVPHLPTVPLRPGEESPTGGRGDAGPLPTHRTPRLSESSDPPSRDGRGSRRAGPKGLSVLKSSPSPFPGNFWSACVRRTSKSFTTWEPGDGRRQRSKTTRTHPPHPLRDHSPRPRVPLGKNLETRDHCETGRQQRERTTGEECHYCL